MSVWRYCRRDNAVRCILGNRRIGNPVKQAGAASGAPTETRVTIGNVVRGYKSGVSRNAGYSHLSPNRMQNLVFFARFCEVIAYGGLRRRRHLHRTASRMRREIVEALICHPARRRRRGVRRKEVAVCRRRGASADGRRGARFSGSRTPQARGSFAQRIRVYVRRRRLCKALRRRR